MIARTSSLHRALHDVADHAVDFHPGTLGGHGRGFSWHDGGTVPSEEQEALASLVVVHLVAEIPAQLCDGIGCVLCLTPDGEQVLSDWDRQGDAA